MYLVTAKEMQTIDKTAIESFGIPGPVLMENAGRGAIDMLINHFPDLSSSKVAVLAGRGNNGGDGFVMARYLLERGIETTTFIFTDKQRISGDAKVNLTLLEKLIQKRNDLKQSNSGECKRSDNIVSLKCYPGKEKALLIEVADLDTFYNIKPRLVHHDLFIDGILGTGLNSDVRGIYKDVIDMVNATEKPIFSIDIPSGLNADTGKAMGTCIQAAATATFAFAKVGHMLQPGKTLSGKLEIIDIGIPGFITEKQTPTVHLIQREMIASLFPDRPVESHKGNFGHLLVIAGSAGKTGAAALACNSAMACGTGLLTLAVPASINPAVEPQVTESMTLPIPEKSSESAPKGCFDQDALKAIVVAAEDKKALAVGPGLGLAPETVSLVRAMITDRTLSEIPMILDADGINALTPYATDVSLAKDSGSGNEQIDNNSSSSGGKDDQEADIGHAPQTNSIDNSGNFANALIDLKTRTAPTILTPHPGEMARLIGKTPKEVQSNRMETARRFAKQYQVIVVLKGAGTIVALPDGNTYICPTGNPGMASGGMGDVLTGIISGFAAQGLSAADATLAGVYIHGLCGDILSKNRGAFGFTATNIIDIIPETIHTRIRQVEKS